MKEIALVFLATGFEDIEAIAQVDILRRAGIAVKTVSVEKQLQVISAHNVSVKADMLIDDLAEDAAPLAIILPGGLPGASNLFASKKLMNLIKKQNEAKRWIAAICASPGVVLAPSGVLNDRKATAYPSFEKHFDKSTSYISEGVVLDGHIITAQGPAFSIPFGLTIAKAIKGEAVAKEVANGMLVRNDLW
ncbi:DJ-1 family protein [Bacteroidales bacterium KA00251]|nr:DJ-1 family protein [Bacteroidales bacterium KA00251]